MTCPVHICSFSQSPMKMVRGSSSQLWEKYMCWTPQTIEIVNQYTGFLTSTPGKGEDLTSSVCLHVLLLLLHQGLDKQKVQQVWQQITVELHYGSSDISALRCPSTWLCQDILFWSRISRREDSDVPLCCETRGTCEDKITDWDICNLGTKIFLLSLNSGRNWRKKRTCQRDKTGRREK